MAAHYSNQFRPRREIIVLSAAFILDKAVRRDYLTLWHFLDIMRDIAHKVSDPLLGEIRLQWWQEGILTRAQASDRDPLLIEIKRIVHRYSLDIESVSEMIAAQSLWLDKGEIDWVRAMKHIDTCEGQLARWGARMLNLSVAPDFPLAMRPFGLTGFRLRQKIIRDGNDDGDIKRLTKMIARQCSYHALPLLMPSLVRAEQTGLSLRLSLLKTYVLGA